LGEDLPVIIETGRRAKIFRGGLHDDHGDDRWVSLGVAVLTRHPLHRRRFPDSTGPIERQQGVAPVSINGLPQSLIRLLETRMLHFVVFEGLQPCA
jgi:hypothetical protein